MATSDRSAGVKKRRMAASYRGSKRPPNVSGKLMEPTPILSPSPQPMNQYPPMRPGPCFDCAEMGHLRANCPK